jgi:hypothetical protein
MRAMRRGTGPWPFPSRTDPMAYDSGNRLLLCTLVFRHSMASFDPQLSVALGHTVSRHNQWRIVLLLGRSDLILLQFMRSWRRAWSASRPAPRHTIGCASDPAVQCGLPGKWAAGKIRVRLIRAPVG